MEKPKTIKIDDQEYIRADEVEGATGGDRCVVVLDRGWVFVGDIEATYDDYGNQIWRLSRCSNVRKWSSGGFGGMIKDPKGCGVVLDPCGPIEFSDTAVILRAPVAGDWAE